MKLKAKKISSQIQRELSIIMQDEGFNQIIKNITITGCEVTNDLSFAKVFYTYLGDYKNDEVTKSLEDVKNQLRHKLANTIKVRHTPELRFSFDESIEYGNRIEKLISKINIEK